MNNVLKITTMLFIVYMLSNTVMNAQKIKIQYFDTTDRMHAIQYFQENGMPKNTKKKKGRSVQSCTPLQCHVRLHHIDQESGEESLVSQAQPPIYSINGVYDVLQQNFPQYITRIDYTLTGPDGFRKTGYIDLRDRSKFYDTEDIGVSDWNAAGADTICIFADGSVMHRIYVS